MAMQCRSWLFVPGSSERKLGKAVETGADVIIVDLEDSVPAESKSAARGLAVQWLQAHRRKIIEQRAMGRWVRINPLESRQWREDLLAVVPARPDGIVLPKSGGPDSVRQLAAELYELEQRFQIPLGSIQIMPMVGETPTAALNITSYVEAPHQRLSGMTWGTNDLMSAMGATRRHIGKTGGWSDVFRFVRAQTLLSAHACGVVAIDTPHTDIADLKGLRLAARAARADGFFGMLALHPEQVPEINEAFTLSAEELTEAQMIVAAFDANPGLGTVLVDRRMIERPHLKLARRILGMDQPSVRENQRSTVLRSA